MANTHNYCAALGVYNFIPYRNIVYFSCRRHRRRCRRSFGRRAREHCAHTVSLSALCISHTYIVHIHNLVCASRVSNSPYDYILYFAFHIISSTAPADYIVTDFAVVYVHAHECVVCSGCYVVFFCFSSLLLLYVTHNKRDDIVLAGWLAECGVCSIFTILMVGPVTSESQARECDITYFVWPIILDVNGLSRSKDVATCCVGYSIFYYYLLCISLRSRSVCEVFSVHHSKLSMQNFDSNFRKFCF